MISEFLTPFPEFTTLDRAARGLNPGKAGFVLECNSEVNLNWFVPIGYKWCVGEGGETLFQF